MRLSIQHLRLTYRTSRRYTFPTPASNRLRSSIGYNIRDWDEEIYARAFAPALTAGPSGLNDPPRPFVLRASHLDARTVEQGETFYFDMHLLDLRLPWREIVAECFEAVLYHFAVRAEAKPVELSLDPVDTRVDRLGIQFLTPTELKTKGGLAEQPDFGVLAARARDRIATLCALYGDGPLAMDFAGFGERAAAVVMTRCDVRRVEAERRSRNTGQTHSLGGFVGEAEYAGDLAEFLPILRAAQWTGVGRQTSWGKGHISLSE